MLAALVGLAATLCSCEKNLQESGKSKVSVNVQALNIENTPFTRATEAQPPHRIVFKAFDANGNVAYETTQVSGQDGYGSLDFELSSGTYTFVAVAHDLAVSSSDPTVAATITSATEASAPEALVQDMFCSKLNVTITSGVPFTADMALPRVISRFQIYLNDIIPEGTKMFKIVANTAGESVTGNATFNPSTGFALSSRQYVKEVDISPAIGTSNNSVSINMFLTAAEQAINITATAYDGSGNAIVTHTLTNVPMKQNKVTVAKGNFFTAGGSGTFSFSTTWDTENQITY